MSVFYDSSTFFIKAYLYIGKYNFRISESCFVEFKMINTIKTYLVV